jgi:WD40 repeat protein
MLSVEIQIGTRWVMVGVLFLPDDFSHIVSTSADNEVMIYDMSSSECHARSRGIAIYIYLHVRTPEHLLAIF